MQNVYVGWNTDYEKQIMDKIYRKTDIFASIQKNWKEFIKSTYILT